MAWICSLFLLFNTPCLLLPLFVESASYSFNLVKASLSCNQYLTSPFLAKKASWGFSMSQWSSLLSKVASISLQMAESTFIFMTSATCHLEIVFGRLGVVLFLRCVKIYNLFSQKKSCHPDTGHYCTFSVYIVCPLSMLPFFKKPNISTMPQKEICTWSSNQQFESALGTYHWNEPLHGGHATTKTCLASIGQQALSSLDHSWPSLGKGPWGIQPLGPQTWPKRYWKVVGHAWKLQ